jgi:ATP-dependent DNA helicase RecG
MYNRKTNNHTEIRVFPYITIDDLDSQCIENARQRAIAHKRGEVHLWSSLSDLDLLKSAKLYGKDATTDREGLNLAGILLLGSEQLIISALPHHKTDAILRIRNLNRYDDRDVICVNLIDSYNRLMAFISKHLDDPFFLEGTQRVSIRNAIFREVCSNLLIHREFSNAFPAKLIIERDHVRTENSNRPHGYGELDPTDFSPFPKNPIISSFLEKSD